MLKQNAANGEAKPKRAINFSSLVKYIPLIILAGKLVQELYEKYKEIKGEQKTEDVSEPIASDTAQN